MNRRHPLIHIVGPGGAGKTTLGSRLAARLNFAFLDLDQHFVARVGDVSDVIAAQGYEGYARGNVETYVDARTALVSPTVMAMSSGFMVYNTELHPAYPEIRREIDASPLTVVLLPSFDEGACVAETVRRQRQRPFARSAEREEDVIRERFGAYRRLSAAQFETAGFVDVIVEQVTVHLRQRLGPVVDPAPRW
jgi:shikimate kinase